MKKIILLLCLLCALPIMAQKSKTFKVACLNIDGLPPKVDITFGIINAKAINMNPKGPQESGTLKMSELVAQKGWDFFAISEAFNYNEQFLTNIKGQYSHGTFRESIPTKVGTTDALSRISLNGTTIREDTIQKSFDTDGLNILYKNSVSVSNEKMVGWKMRHGVTDFGSDFLIDKGYRYYTVSLGAGLDVDVYILHMDAETTERDNVARAVQIKQLVEAIKATDNKRPIIIMGDTNCRYTRDDLKGLLIDNINSDSRFEIHDPWVDYMWDGNYPKLGSNALMVGQYGHQKGEVVDKIFYINNKDADAQLTAHGYLQDMDFTNPDGSEISDHFPIVIKFTIENLSESVAEGEDYFIRNVATKEYIAAGAEWGTHGVIARTGNRLTLKSTGTENTFTIGSTLHPNDAESTPAFLSAELYMDSGDRNPFVFTRVKGTKYYTITNNGESLSYDSDKRLVKTTLQSDDPNQQWEVLKLSELTKELKDNASEANPMDATFFIKGANFSRNDRDRGEWKTQYSSSKVWGNIGGWGKTADNEKNAGIATGSDLSSNFIAEMYTTGNTNRNSNSAKVYQTLKNLPIGKYRLTFQGFVRRDGDNNDFNVSINGVTCPIMNLSTVQGTAPNNMAEAAALFNTGACTHTMEFTVKNESDIELAVNRPNENKEVWVAFDNFVLTYLGPTDEDIAIFNKVKAAIDDAQKKADEAGYSTYDNSVVEERYENRTLSSNGDEEVHMTYLQLANAARKQTGEMPVDMRYALLNNSFEMGDLTEWTSSGNAEVVPVTAQTVEGEELGEYRLKTSAGTTVSQQIQVTMRSGVYELSAYVTAGVKLIAGDRQSAPAQGDGLVKVSQKFIIDKGTATVGVTSDGAFEADHFILRNIGDSDNAASYEKLRMAISDATRIAGEIDQTYLENEWKPFIQPYQEMVDNMTVDGNGDKEVTEIYAKVRSRVFSNTADRADYTLGIINPSFELGNTFGWDATLTGADSGARSTSNATYKMNSSDGNWLFNTWNDGEIGSPISQTITGLPKGHYVLTFIAASHDGKILFVEADDHVAEPQRSDALKLTGGQTSGHAIEFEFDVADSSTSTTITVIGANNDGKFPEFIDPENPWAGPWYKVDDFHLLRDNSKNDCNFYRNIKKVLDRLDMIANNHLTPKWQAHWNEAKGKYVELYEQHINSDHSDSSELAAQENKVINDIYADFRAIVYSQKQVGADFSGAITNHSFELGDFTGWTIETNAGENTNEYKVLDKNTAASTYTTENVSLDHFCNLWTDGNVAPPISQNIGEMPAGRYEFSVKLATDPANKIYIAVKVGDAYVTKLCDATNAPESGDPESGNFKVYSLEFETPGEGAPIEVGIFPSADGNFYPDLNPAIRGGWYKADDFHLTMLGRDMNINWKMEYDNEGIGSIILPFDAKVPSDLQIYSFTVDENQTLEGFYMVGLLEPATTGYIKANTPYIVKREAAQTGRKAARTTADELPEPVKNEDGSYTFTGRTTHSKDRFTPEDQVLTGTMVETTAQTGERHLRMDALGNIGFFYHAETSEAHEPTSPYHVYIASAPEQSMSVPVYISDPTIEIEWTMETALYGTLILPFDAEVPAGLNALTISGLSDSPDEYLPKNGTEKIQYQLLICPDIDSETEKLEAYKPYLMRAVVTPEATAAEGDDAATDNKTFTFRGVVADKTGATLENGLLKGAVTDGEEADANNYMLAYDNRNKEVFSALDAAQAVNRYHAYIPAAGVNADTPKLLFFEAPSIDDVQSGLQVVAIDSEAIVDVFSIDGITLRTGIEAAEALEGLAPGIYVLRTASGATLKVLKR